METTKDERAEWRAVNAAQRGSTEDAYFCADEVTNDQMERLLDDADRCEELERMVSADGPHSSAWINLERGQHRARILGLEQEVERLRECATHCECGAGEMADAIEAMVKAFSCGAE